MWKLLQLLPKMSKVKIGSWARFINPGKGIVHDIFNQTHYLVPSRHPNLAKNKQFEGYSGPNHMCAWLQRTSEVFQNQNWFKRRYDKAWYGNRTWLLKPTTAFSAKLTPIFWVKMSSSRANLAQITCTHGYRLLHKHSKAKIDSWEKSEKLGMRIVHDLFIQTHHLLPTWPPNLVKNDQFRD